MTALEGSNPTIRTYGASPEQFAELSVPSELGPHPVVVLVHGGFWRARFGLNLMAPLRNDLLARGFATYNLEYRRVGQPGGGYPGTLADVALGIDELATIADAYHLDLSRMAVVGHSAGGHLALWAAGRDLLPAGAVGAEPPFGPRIVVGLAAVTDLARAAAERLGQEATQEFMGGDPTELEAEYAIAQPRLHPARTVLVHGDSDDRVPTWQSQQFAGLVEVVITPGEDHFDVIDPGSRSWAAAVDAIETIRVD